MHFKELDSDNMDNLGNQIADVLGVEYRGRWEFGDCPMNFHDPVTKGDFTATDHISATSKLLKMRAKFRDN